VLVLDEPANGLDPAGMREIRELVRRLGDEGRTVFLSSHLLGEVQQVCDRVAIVARGRTLATGRVEEVLATGRSAVVLVRVAVPDAGISALQAAGLDAMLDGAGMIRVQVPDEGPEAVARALARRDVYPTELRPEDASLEDVFLRLTSDEGVGK
jgi:ABC-type multidrug transport system ATPase subunit